MDSKVQGKSLRQLAKEVGVSHSYLSQVIHGKRPVSKKIAYALCKDGVLSLNGKQMVSKYGKQSLVENISKITYNESASGSSSVVEHLLPKQRVASSSFVSRSTAKPCGIAPSFYCN